MTHLLSRIVFILLISTFSLTSFSAGIKMTGESVSTPAFTETILKALLPSYISRSGCHEPVTSINRRVLDQPKNSVLSTLIKEIQPGAWTVKEEWDVKGCGKIKPMYVNIGRDLDGMLGYEMGFIAAPIKR